MAKKNSNDPDEEHEADMMAEELAEEDGLPINPTRAEIKKRIGYLIRQVQLVNDRLNDEEIDVGTGTGMLRRLNRELASAQTQLLGIQAREEGRN